MLRNGFIKGLYYVGLREKKKIHNKINFVITMGK